MRVSEGLLGTTECSPPRPLSHVGERRAEVLRRVRQTGPGLAGGSTIWAIAVSLRWIECREDRFRRHAFNARLHHPTKRIRTASAFGGSDRASQERIQVAPVIHQDIEAVRARYWAITGIL